MSARPVPTKRTVPAATASVRSVSLRSTSTGTPKEGASSWTPPESVIASVHPVTTQTEFFDVLAQRSGLTGDQSDSSNHSPRLFVQTPQRVARAVVRCLRHPKPEVWTSFVARLGAGVLTVSPRLGHLMMRRFSSAVRPK